ncbi:hypothetical protein FRB94_010596 [Tulasnella sp. JGI-2019a]|nr:hypothetical protein FRB94_010596 [Tulasnella sp. JGI-2019a]
MRWKILLTHVYILLLCNDVAAFPVNRTLQYGHKQARAAAVASTVAHKHSKRGINLEFLGKLFSSGAKDVEVVAARKAEATAAREAEEVAARKAAGTVERGATTITRTKEEEEHVVTRITRHPETHEITSISEERVNPVTGQSSLAKAERNPITREVNVAHVTSNAHTGEREAVHSTHDATGKLIRQRPLPVTGGNAEVAATLDSKVRQAASGAVGLAGKDAEAQDAKPLSIFGHLKKHAGTIMNVAMILPMLYDPAKSVYHKLTGQKDAPADDADVDGNEPEKKGGGTEKVEDADADADAWDTTNSPSSTAAPATISLN